MRVTIVNLTESPILYQAEVPGHLETDNKVNYPSQIALLPTSCITADLPRRCSKITLSPKVELKHGDQFGGTLSTEKFELRAIGKGFSIPIKSLKQSRLLAEIDGGERCPWRICRTKESWSHYKLVILPFRNLSSFLSSIPDTVPLSSLLLPGTHETMAFYGWPLLQCQNSPITSAPNALLTQLHSGIRVLDIRLSVLDGKLVTFHGPYPERTSFAAILKTLHYFLSKEGSRECVVVSIKQESLVSPHFTKLVISEINSSPGGPGFWFTESNRIPTLGEVRGRCILFSRFGEPSTKGLGIHPDVWPDSKKEGFNWICGETIVRVSDWWRIWSFLAIPKKVKVSTSVLLPPPETTIAPLLGPPNAATSPSLSITFFSATSFPLALPSLVARGFGKGKLAVTGVNERVGIWLLHNFGDKGQEPRIRGWTFMDFYEDPIESAVVPLLVECNFRGRKIGEEGWC